jgi:hypothetical protein
MGWLQTRIHDIHVFANPQEVYTGRRILTAVLSAVAVARLQDSCGEGDVGG